VVSNVSLQKILWPSCIGRSTADHSALSAFDAFFSKKNGGAFFSAITIDFFVVVVC